MNPVENRNPGSLIEASLLVLQEYYALSLEAGAYRLEGNEVCTSSYLKLLESAFLIASQATPPSPCLLQSIAWRVGEACFHDMDGEATSERLQTLKGNVKQCLAETRVALPFICEG
ncbi:hypothetical protein [Acaryochloris sp. CCMEE 5410]|uniref:hypothetical protein n=1 Tax=Acaryochloris sp. CCMEE 5410 TaxID=310037 RepID=UPI0002483FBA|nr:hypothetical protein [Acaryochloris sp. CCMEE 5410]KAI9129870.1 hypothetical protein ON05_032630 [Acaryochloris sp. CCMEE 5410]